MKKLIKNFLCLIGLLVAAGMFFGCDSDSILSSNATQGDIIAQKSEASSIVQAAHNEFFEGINSIDDVRTRAEGDEELDVEDWGIKEQIIAEAWTAYYTGDDSKVIELLKENDLYDKYKEIEKKYDLEKQEEILATPSGAVSQDRSVSQSFFNQFMSGDVFLCYGGSSSSSSTVSLLGMLIPGHWKHAGIMNKSASANAPVLSASNNTTSGFCVGYETTTKWAGESAVIAMRVSGNNGSNGQAAVNYGNQFIGRDFNFVTSRDSNDLWYCSKVVYRCWLSQGKDLEYNTWNYWRGAWVTPQDIYDDGDTYYVGGDSW